MSGSNSFSSPATLVGSVYQYAATGGGKGLSNGDHDTGWDLSQISLPITANFASINDTPTIGATHVAYITDGAAGWALPMNIPGAPQYTYRVIGTANNDTFIASTDDGNLYIDGGPGGTDVLQMQDVARSQVTQAAQSDGSVLFALSGTTIHATRIAQVQFSDGTVALPAIPTMTGPAPVILIPSSNAVGTAALSTSANLAGLGFGVANGQLTITTGSGASASTTKEAVSGVTQVTFGDGVAVVDPRGNASEVARLYQAVFGRGPDADGLQYWAMPLDAGTLGLSQVEAAFLATPEVTRMGAEDLTSFVESVYRNALGRAPDAAGVSYWSDAVGHGGATRADVLQAIGESGEAQVRTAGTFGSDAASEVARLYTAIVGRLPDVSGQQYWADQIEAGQPLQQIAQGLLASPEFMTSGLDTAQLVTRLYANELGRAPDASGLTYWVGQIDGGNISAAGAAVGFAQSTEAMSSTSFSSHQGWVWVAGTH